MNISFRECGCGAKAHRKVFLAFGWFLLDCLPLSQVHIPSQMEVLCFSLADIGVFIFQRWEGPSHRLRTAWLQT